MEVVEDLIFDANLGRRGGSRRAARIAVQNLGLPWPHKLGANPPVRGRADTGSLRV